MCQQQISKLFIPSKPQTMTRHGPQIVMGIGQAGLLPSLRQARSGHNFFLNREGLDFFRSLFSLKGQVGGHSKSLLGLLDQPI